MSRRVLVAIVVVVLASGGIAGWWFAESADTPLPTSVAADAGKLATPSTEVPKSGTSPGDLAARSQPGLSIAAVAATLSTLPPPGTDPLAVVNALLASADAGNRRAACRVAIELMTCQHAAAMKGERWVRGDLEALSGAEEADRQSRMDAAIAAVDTRCQQVPAATRARTAELLAAAAHAGEPDAALLYAQGFHLMGHTASDFVAHPGFDRWRAEAEAMVWQQFRAGDRGAAFLLAIGAQDDFGLLGGLIDNDPVTARAMWLLMSRISAHRSTMKPLPPIEERRAAGLAARWHHEHFDDRIDTSDDTTTALGSATPWFGDINEPERCTGEITR